MNTAAFIESLRADIEQNLLNEIMEKLQPEINRRLYANIFDVKEAVRYLKISESTLRKMVKAKELPHFRLRGQIFFRQIDIDRYIEGLCQDIPKEVAQ